MESGERADMAKGDAWYSATALFKAVHPGETRRRHLWERDTFLLRAPDDLSARNKAERLANGIEHEYDAMDGHPVRWVFQSVERVQRILDDELGEGTEVSWEFFDRVDRH